MSWFIQGCGPGWPYSACAAGQLRKHCSKSPTWPGVFLVLGFVWLVLAFAGACRGEDWPTAGHDRARSGITSDQLRLPLERVWVDRAQHAPRPAWPAPAKQDIWHRHRGLQPEMAYDRAFHVVAAGGAVFYGSSADDKVYCLDAATGRVKWSFFTEGPVRLAPTIAGKRLYVGSDDGCVYCLATDDGKLLWRRRVAPDDRRVPGNGRMMSVWPVRTGVLVDGGVAYCCAGLFPNEGVYVCALHGENGSVIWRAKTDRASPQGYLMASATRLFAPAGRTPPVLFDRRDGRYVGTMAGEGGAFALVDRDILVSGPGRTTGRLSVSDSRTREGIATLRGLHMIVHNGRAYLHTRSSITALDRVKYLALARERNALAKKQKNLDRRIAKAKKARQAKELQTLQGQLKATKTHIADTVKAMKKCFLWRRSCDCPYSLILAGDALFAGGDGRLAAFGVSDGKELWTAGVAGRAYALAVAGGRLFVSTDRGSIYCYKTKEIKP